MFLIAAKRAYRFFSRWQSKPKLASGSTARTVRTVRDGTPRSTRRGRPPKNPRPAQPGFQSEYEKTRITEIGARAALNRLKFQKLNGQVLDRKLLLGELTAIFSSIREIILASSMTKREKDDCLRNLAEIPVVLENVAAKQSGKRSDGHASKRRRRSRLKTYCS